MSVVYVGILGDAPIRTFFYNQAAYVLTGLYSAYLVYLFRIFGMSAMKVISEIQSTRVKAQTIKSMSAFILRMSR